MTVVIQDDIKAALDRGAALVVSVSGGKDSDAMAYALNKLRKEHSWTGRWVLIHADVGRMEWAQSLPHCEKLAAKVGAEFVVVKHKKRDLLENIWKRMADRPDAPPFPSPAYRQCTSDFKRGPINVWLRNAFVENCEVVVTMGLRAEESTARKNKVPCQIRKNVTAVTKNRNVLDWLPIHRWTEEDVWREIGIDLPTLKAFQDLYQITKDDFEKTAKLLKAFPAHPAYLFGNERVSCSSCIMGSDNDLRNGAEYQTETYIELCRVEVASGYSYQAKGKDNKWLGAIRPDLLPENLRNWYIEKGIVDAA